MCILMDGRFLAYAAVLWKLQTDRSALGMSLQTLFALVFTEINNVILQVMLSHKYKFPLGAAFYVCDVATTALSTFCFFYVLKHFYATYESTKDTFGLKFFRAVFGAQVARSSYWLFLYLVAFMLAVPLFLFRRSPLPGAFSIYECFDDALLAVALLPQLYMFYNKRPRKVSGILGNFIIFLLMARLCALTYWLTYPLFKRGAIPSRGLHIATESLNILILIDFLYYYLVAKAKGMADISLPI